MKRTIRDNITGLPYSLHDMTATGLTVCTDELTISFADGFERIGTDCVRVGGELCFHKVDWDFSFAYVLDFCANEGRFRGEKRFLADFAAKHRTLAFEVIDESYGYNSTRLAGLLSVGRKQKECVLEIYHLGAMEYITQE